MLKLTYILHILLQSRYKLLLNILIYVSVIIIYYIILNDITIIECMKKASSDIPIPEETQEEYIQFLENEILQIDAKRSSLEHYSKQLERKLDSTETEPGIEQIKEDQNTLIEEVQSLEGQLAEAKETTKELAHDNIDLKHEIVERHQSYIEQLKELEAQKKDCEDKLTSLRK